MIKLILAVTFLFAVSAQVSGKMINCYVCTTDRNDNTTPLCKDPLEGSHTVTVDSNEYSCFTEFVTGSIEMDGPPMNLNYTLRGYTDVSRSKGVFQTTRYSRSCRECQSDKCNTLATERDYYKFGSTQIISHESDSQELDSYESALEDGAKRNNSDGRGKTMDCYVCTTDRNDNTKPQCKDPLEGSHTETVDSTRKWCFTMFINGSYQEVDPPMNYNFTIRGHTDMYQCGKVAALSPTPEISRNSYECKSDKCNTCTEDDPEKCKLIKSNTCTEDDPQKSNSAISIRVSFLKFLGFFGSLYAL